MAEGRAANKGRKAAEQALDDVNWKIGDWLLTGEAHLKEGAYQEAERITKTSRSTLYDYARVARAFPPPVRDKSLSFTHYKYLTPLSPDTQQTLLAEIRDHKMSSMALRKELGRRGMLTRWGRPRSLRGKKASSNKSRRVKIEIPKDEYQLLRDVALARGYSDGVNGVIRNVTLFWLASNKEVLMREVLVYQEKCEEDNARLKAERGAQPAKDKPPQSQQMTWPPRNTDNDPLLKEIRDRETQILHGIFKERGKIVADDANAMLRACVQTLVAGEFEDDEAFDHAEFESLLLAEREFVRRLEAADGAEGKISLMTGMLDAKEQQDRAAAKAVVDEIKAAGKQAAKDRRLAREAASKQEKSVS